VGEWRDEVLATRVMPIDRKLNSTYMVGIPDVGHYRMDE